MPAVFSTTNILSFATSWRSGVGTGNAPNNTDATNPAFPPKNLATYRAGKVCRFKTLGPGVIEADLSSPMTGDVVALINHNLHPAADVRIACSTSLAGPWETLPLQILPYSCWQKFPTSLVRRYWKLTIASAKTIDNQPVQIGELFVGPLQTLPPFVYGLEEGMQNISSFLETEYGYPVTHFLAERRTFKGNFVDALKPADAFVVNDLKRTAQGRVKPFLFIPNLNDGSNVMLGRLASDTWINKHVLPGRVGKLDFNFLEDPFGKTGE